MTDQDFSVRIKGIMSVSKRRIGSPENDFEAMQALEEATGRTAPASLAVLRQKAERFSTVIDPAQIAEVALGCQA